MKKLIISAIILSVAMTGCKKNNDDACKVTVTAIAANYRITKIEVVSSSGNSDVTNTFLDDCKKGGFYQLKTDNTYQYTEIGSSCTGTGTGVWSATNNTVTITGAGGFQFTAAPVESWNCSVLTLTQDINVAGSNVKGRFTFTKL